MKYLLLMLVLLCGCGPSPESIKRQKIEAAWDSSNHTCVVIRVAVSNNARSYTSLRCLENDGIYEIGGYLGDAKDTIKVSGNLLNNFHKIN